ncbi:MAG: hypothetical protein F9K40_19835 [Kofleriaceae bacterium]|nr:MAG: hypothetical protein F9K40_19835 [Kofleriaceae bacterium]
MRTSLVLALAMSATLGSAGCGGKGGGASEPSGASLRVTSIEPTSAAATGGVPLHIHGSGFIAESRAIQVYIGDAPANVLSVDSDTELQVEVPPGEAGKAVDVKLVFDPGGEIKLPHALTFVPGN